MTRSLSVVMPINWVRIACQLHSRPYENNQFKHHLSPLLTSAPEIPNPLQTGKSSFSSNYRSLELKYDRICRCFDEKQRKSDNSNKQILPKIFLSDRLDFNNYECSLIQIANSLLETLFFSVFLQLGRWLIARHLPIQLRLASLCALFFSPRRPFIREN